MNQLSLQEFCKTIYFHVINIVWFFLHETNSRGHKCKSIASKTFSNTNRQYLKHICVYIKILFSWPNEIHESKYSTYNYDSTVCSTLYNRYYNVMFKSWFHWTTHFQAKFQDTIFFIKCGFNTAQPTCHMTTLFPHNNVSIKC